MFKDKNKVTKISNGILLAMLILSLISSISLIATLITGDIPQIEGYTKNDLMYDTFFMLSYTLIAGVTLLILNKKVDLYKDEYAVSMQVFNLFIVLSLVSSAIMLVSTLITYFIYNEFSLYSLLGVLIGYLPTYIIAFIYVKKHKFLSKENTTKTNVINFLVIYLVMSYIINVILLILQLQLREGYVIETIQNICVSLIWLCVVLLAYKMLNRETKVNEVKEVVIIEEKEKTKKKKNTKKK